MLQGFLGGRLVVWQCLECESLNLKALMRIHDLSLERRKHQEQGQFLWADVMVLQRACNNPGTTCDPQILQMQLLIGHAGGLFEKHPSQGEKESESRVLHPATPTTTSISQTGTEDKIKQTQ